MLSAICHGDQPQVDAMFPALAEALRSLGDHQAALYHDVVLAGLPAAARIRWEAFMTTILAPGEYLSDAFRDLAAEHEARGEVRGEAHALLTVLDARGIAVPSEIRDRILSCTDPDQLDSWLRRAGTATKIDDVLHPDSADQGQRHAS